MPTPPTGITAPDVTNHEEVWFSVQQKETATMSTTIATDKVTERRELHFNTIEDIRAEVERLAQCHELRALGNWSTGQIFQHLAIGLNCCIDGYPHQLPAPVRLALRFLFKRRFLMKPMAAGFKLPAKAAALLPPPTTQEVGLRNLRQALERFEMEPKRVPNPVLGPLTNDEWIQLQCRHAELHLSFLVPVR
jgi:hypothetical protein